MKYLHKPGEGGKSYVSEFERFMDGFLQDHPDVERDKIMGWRIWWERHVKPGEIDGELRENMSRPGYYYD